MGTHNHSHDHDKTPASNIKIAFFLNLIFTIVELVGGFLTNSLAIISDALHDLGDSFSLGLSWYLSKLSEKKRTPTFTYGYKRFSMLGALINSLVLLVGSLVILSEAVPRILHPEHSHAKGMFLFAILGVTVNGLAALRVRRGKTMNEKVVALHLLEDVLGWVAVLIVSIVIMIRDTHILDPILAVLITLYILWNVIKNLKESMKIFLQSVPGSLRAEDFEKSVMSNEKVEGVHNTHIWTLDGTHHVLSTNIIVDKTAGMEEVAEIKRKAKKIAEDYGIGHSTVEIEFGKDDCKC